MIRVSDSVKCMASLATFRKMLKDRQTIYDVIAQMAGQIIIEKAIYEIDVNSLRSLLEETTGIDVPTSIVRTSMKHLDFVMTDNGNVAVNDKLTPELKERTLTQIEENKKRDQIVYNALFSYVETKIEKRLTSDEQDLLKADFCSYIVDDSHSVKYAEYISNFIISKRSDDSFMEQMRQIREGMIIILGLSYNVNEGSIDIVDTPLCLYLETEVLFHMAGFNGDLSKCLFEEFLQQVNAVNKRAGKSLIKLLYFEETFNEIERYFRTAEEIVEKRTKLDFSKTAMKTIVSGCQERYDVIQKKADFIKKLKNLGITLDSQANYYDKENIGMNIVQQNIIDELINKDFDEGKIYEKLGLINYIYIKRGQKSHKIFRNVGHILVTANSLTFAISNREEIHKSGDVPIAWSLDCLTSRFWLSLNKGIMPDSHLKSFDLLSKARIVLASKVNSSVERLSNEIDKELSNGTLTKDKAILGIIELRKNCVTPDEITEENADNYLAIINEESIHHVIAESEARKRKSQQVNAELLKEKKDLEDVLENESKFGKAATKILMEKINKEIEEQYNANVKEYECAKYEFVKEQFCRYRLKNWFIAIGFALLVAILFIIGCISENEKKWYYIVLSFIVFAAGMYLPLIEKYIREAYKFVCMRDIRKLVRKQIEKEYEGIKKRPIRNLKSEDDIRNEIQIHNKSATESGLRDSDPHLKEK